MALALISEVNLDPGGLFTSVQARGAGRTDSALVRMAQRGNIERVARGVYRIAFFPQAPLSQLREAVLWAGAHRGPETVAISHESALAVFKISDANPSRVHVTVPRSARMRREIPKAVELHRTAIDPSEITVVDGIPVTTVERTVTDLLASGCRIDLIKQAISGARKEGFISGAEAQRLRRRVQKHIDSLRAAEEVATQP